MRLLRDLSGYDWVHELVDDDPAVRSAALARHHTQIGEATGTLGDLVAAFCGWRGNGPQPELAPYGVLFLQWELRFPDEWRENWRYSSPWTAKECVLTTFCTCAPTPELEDLVLATVRRVQRCQDSEYWNLARRIDSPSLRARLAEAAQDAEERTRLRARFLLWLMDNPTENTRGPGWRRWLRSEGRPLTHPVAALDRMPPAAAAAEVADLAPADLARVLESLHAGPAARIMTALLPAESVARAVELMDAHLARRALRAMEQPDTTAAVLAAMEPTAAASRFPGSSRREVFELLDDGAMVAVLRAMPTAIAIDRLESLPPEKALELGRQVHPEVAAAMGERIGGVVPLRRRPRKRR